MFGNTEFRDSGNVYGGLFFSAIIALVISVLILMFYGISQRSNIPLEEKVVVSYNLTSLDANEDINGEFSQSFFVGSGYIGEDLYYHIFYEKIKGGEIMQVYDKIRAESIDISETDGNPRYTIYGNYMTDTTNYYYSPNIQETTRSVLYIPKGTIKKNFKVN